jgi:transcriptional regulator with XRE-family HTH domain
LIQQHRKARRLTLDQLAASSGVSRSMLSQIERGEANPTFSTLWNVTRALGMELSELIAAESLHGDPVEVQPVYATPEIRTSDGKCVLRILSPVQMAGGTEWYLLTMAPGGELRSDAHARGTREHLTTLDGELVVETQGSDSAVPAGATARYPADIPHVIVNRTGKEAVALLVVVT